ncbi:hypothetical protein BJ980_001983 [Nocardioides daedukensis]|uniref:Integral membrane protein n=1 Tax=Nocardioides daedukensis TaxID=634462 RepID=A0A7Y9S443_9ACTN|nr:hypothetical protein [Nocardioides daedukensis]NYG59060.1 hypothetical protein [Nocardioides daedukensis]
MTTRTQNPSLTTTRLTLRTVLLLDAGISGLNGIAYLAGAAVLDDLLGPSATVLLVLGAFLLVWAGVLEWVATRKPIPTPLVREVAIANLVWVAASIAAIFLLDLTTVGVVWCLMQAAVVSGFAVLQLRMAAR